MPHYESGAACAGSVNTGFLLMCSKKIKRQYDVTGCARGTEKRKEKKSQSHFFVEQISAELFSTKHSRHCQTLLLALSE